MGREALQLHCDLDSVGEWEITRELGDRHGRLLNDASDAGSQVPGS